MDLLKMVNNIKTYNTKKIVMVVILIVVIILFTLYSIPRYAWKLFGFEYCTNPSIIYIRSIKINSNFINIIGGTIYSAPAYIGKIYKQDDNTLYIGIKYNILLGFLKRNGDFNFNISINSNDIDKIIIKNNQEEKTIYIKDGSQNSNQ
jgi:hypothetical protein